MTNRQLYRQTFEALHASREKLGKVYFMENRKMRFYPGRILLAAACVIALLVGSAFAANAATGGEFFRSVRILLDGGEAELTRVGENSYRYEMGDGYGTLTVTDEQIGEDGLATTITIDVDSPDEGEHTIAVEIDGGLDGLGGDAAGESCIVTDAP